LFYILPNDSALAGHWSALTVSSARRREPKSFAIGRLDLIFRKASAFHDR
jgi:hypothetical protein